MRDTRNESTAAEAEHQTDKSRVSHPGLTSVHVMLLVVVVVNDVPKHCSVQHFTSLLGSETPTLTILSLPSLFSSSASLYTVVYSSQPSLVTIPPIAYLSAHLLEMGNRTS